MKKIFLSLSLIFTLGFFVGSCGHKDLPEPEVDLSLEQLFVRVMSDLNVVQASIDSAYSSIDASYPHRFGGCGTVTPNNANPLDSLFTIDFTGAACHDTLAGKVDVHHKGSYALGTLTDSIVFNSFTINGRSINGYRLRSMIFDTISPGKTFQIQDHITSIESPPRNEIFIQSTLTRTDDNISIINGSVKGNTNADAFIASISVKSPLTFDSICGTGKFRFPKLGVLTFNNTTQNLIRVINFGHWNGSGMSESCTVREATFISPKGNIYTFPLE